MARFLAALTLAGLAGCSTPAPPTASRAAAPPPSPAVAKSAEEPPAAAPAPAPAPAPSPAPAPAPSPAPPPMAEQAAPSAPERKAQLAREAASKGVLGIIGAQGGGGAVADVLSGPGDTAGALTGAGGVKSASGGGLGGGRPKPVAAAPGSRAPPPPPASAPPPAAPSAAPPAPPPPSPVAARGEWPTLQSIPVPTTRKFLGAPPASARTLGDAARFIASALEENGYEELGYFRHQDGFAIATRPERIGGDARPLSARRWPQARTRRTGAAQSLQELFEVNGEPGDRYRAFVFLCMTGSGDVDLAGGAAQTWGLWKTGSANPEGDVLLDRPVGGHKLYAFVYELSQEQGGQVLVATTSLNTAAEHLRGAGLVAFLR